MHKISLHLPLSKSMWQIFFFGVSNVEHDYNILHSYIKYKYHYSPHILRGASNSKRIGCERKISLDFKQSPRISFSVNWTFFPGRDPRTENAE